MKQRFANKKWNAKIENIPFHLSLTEFISLIQNKNLKSSDLGFSNKNGKKMVLARYKDQGGYDITNCRFITQKENANEKIISEKSRLASSNNAKRLVLIQGKEHYTKMHIAANKIRKEKAILNRQQYESFAHKSYLGSNNSQYGSFWITNSEENKKWREDFGRLPSGFQKGRNIGRGW